MTAFNYDAYNLMKQSVIVSSMLAQLVFMITKCNNSEGFHQSMKCQYNNALFTVHVHMYIIIEACNN